MEFRAPRSGMLQVLARALDIPAERESSFLGRFQHLQRLSLIEGINPGRGKAAQYQAHQVVVIALAFQLLQLGISPEKAVQMIKANQDRVRLAISLAIGLKDFEPSYLWFDAALLSQTSDNDRAEATFDYGGAGVVRERFDTFFNKDEVQRMAFISVTNTIYAIVDNLPEVDGPGLREFMQRGFVQSLRDWRDNSNPDSLM